MPKYLSGRTKRTPQNKLTDDRYQYLGLDQAEPNIGDPPTASGTPGIPAVLNIKWYLFYLILEKDIGFLWVVD